MNNYLTMDYHMTYIEEVSTIQLDDFIKAKQNEFLGEIKSENEKGSTYNVLVEPTFYHHIVSVHFVIYAYTGGAHDIRFDKVYYYDLEKNKEISIMDIVNFNDDFTAGFCCGFRMVPDSCLSFDREFRRSAADFFF